VRVEETFVINQLPEIVFDYLTNPSNLSSWQTSNRSVEQLTEAPPGLGSRVREHTKPPLGKEFEQVTEYTEFDRPRRLRVHIVEGRIPSTGRGPSSRTAMEPGSSSSPRASSEG
jgi:uncharacterized protein YndB with AHSA1/START domain